MKWHSFIIASLFSAFAMNLTFAAKDVSVKFATVAPAGTPWAQTLEDIKEEVNKKSGGKVQIKTFLGGQLGGELEILDGVRRGRIQGGGLTSAALGSVIPELNVLEIPFIFESYEEADYVLDNHLLEPFRQLFAKKGMVFVTWAENGWRNIGLKTKNVKRPSDLESVKVRSQESQAHLMFWKKVKANPVPIATPEVLSALQTGLVEGFDNTALFTLAAEWHTGIKFYTVTQHIYQPAAVVYSKKFWDGIGEQERTLLMGHGNGIAPGSRSAVRALGGELLDVLKSSGITVYTLTDAERQRFKESVAGVEKEIVKELGGESQKIYDLIMKAKAEFKNKGKK